MTRLRLICLQAPVLLLGLVFFSCSRHEEIKPAPRPAAPLSPDVRIIATVNGDPILLAEFLERFQRSGIKPEREAERDVKEEFLNRLIERKMMLQEAQRLRIKVSLQEINQRIVSMRPDYGQDVKSALASEGIDFEKWKSDIWEDMMIERLLARDVNRNITVSPAEVRKYYASHPQDFDRPEQVRVRQIVVATEEEATKVLELLRDKHEDFAGVARQKSIGPEASQGGDLGYFSRGDMPAEFNVVFGLARGDVSGIVKSPYGFHIFRLEDRRKAGRIGLDEAAKGIAEKIRREKQDKRYSQWLNGLRARTKFEVNYQALDQ